MKEAEGGPGGRELQAGRVGGGDAISVAPRRALPLNWPLESRTY